MRVIYESIAVPTIVVLPDQSTRRSGTARVLVVAYGPGEPIVRPDGSLHGAPQAAQPVATLKARLGGKPLYMEPPPNHLGPATVEIPSSLFASLPDDTLIIYEWEWNAGGGA